MCLTRNLVDSRVIIDCFCFLGSLDLPLVLQRMEIRETELLTVGPIPGEKATGNQAWVLVGVSVAKGSISHSALAPGSELAMSLPAYSAAPLAQQ